METIDPCCCCLRRPSVKDLKTPYVRLGMTEIFSDMIQECFQLQLTLGTNNECGICEVCVGRLRDASDFKLQVQRCQVELQVRLSRVLRIKEEEPDVLSEMINDDGINIDSVLPPPELEAAGSDALPGGSVSAPTKQLVSTCSVRLQRLRGDKTSHACQICHAAFDHESSLTTHIKEIHDDSTGVQAEEAYTCDACGERFRRKCNLIKHLLRHGETKEQLPSENLIAKPKGSIRVTKPYSCKICNAQFTKRVRFNEHLEFHSRQKNYSCAICKKQFKMEHHMKQHIRIHAGQKRYSCEICKKHFKRIYGLKSHMTTHTGNKPHSCVMCKKRFTQKSSLNEHIRIHIGYKPYSCEICNKQFSKKGNLQDHARVHTGERPFSCEICNKAFTQKSSVKEHMKIHTGEKPHSCEICNKAFIEVSSLKKHIRVHTGQKPYSCKICNKSFTQNGNLQRHIYTHWDRNIKFHSSIE